MSFRRILIEADEAGIKNLEDLKKEKNICNKCCKCNPYLKVSFETQQTEFDKPI